MSELWQTILTHAWNIIPYPIRKRRLNFISIHYIYMGSMAILGSIILYGSDRPIGKLAYIDCLFFASGAATQSGLNTVDVNKITTAQQVTLYFIAMVCNPIFINTFVVFVRLYWFEKRFQHIVREAKTLKRSRSRSRTMTLQRDEENDPGKQPVGVAGRDIKVLHNTLQNTTGASRTEDSNAIESSSDEGDSSSSSDPQVDARRHLSQTLQSEGDFRLPPQVSHEQHIAFLENQRNPTDHTTLRIPSPREFDRGGKVQAIDDSDDEDGSPRVVRQVTREGGIKWQNMDFPDKKNTSGTGRNRITIDEPNIIRDRNKTSTFPRMQSRTRTDETRDATEEPPKPLSERKRRGTFSSLVRTFTTQEKDMDPTPYLSWEPTIGRNSVFVNLTEDQREELGGIEYRALKTLAIVLIGYFVLFHLFGVICFVPWILHTHWGKVVTNDGQSRVWWGIFTAASSFNDLGFTLTPDSMISFGNAVFVMLIMSFLIVIGNTGFPCMLRFVIWFCNLCVPRGSGVWEELRFLLDHPRRCFTLLFPRGATWWLFVILVVLNGMDLLFFIVLDLSDSTISVIPPGLRFVDGLFQAFSTRTAGFAVVNLADLHPAIQVSYLIMMYISVFPIAISMRRTNVYEEKSLGVYGSADDEEEDGNEPSYVGAHLRRQLSFDLWYIFLGLFIIAIAEGDRLQNTNEYSFTLFSVLFEIVSAYGTVGLSLGYPTINASFSAEFNVVSKLVIIAMQIRGRHRGLPYELDRAILLPSESLQSKEQAEDEKRQARRRNSNLSTASAVTGQGGIGPFRPETGLSSGMFNGSPTQAKDRRGTNSTNGSHKSHHIPSAKSGLGNAMFRMATHPEVPLPHHGNHGIHFGSKEEKDA